MPFVKDTYTDTNGTLLDARTPDVGGSPEALSFRFHNDADAPMANAEIRTNRARSVSSDFISRAYRYPDVAPSPDQDVFFTLRHAQTGASENHSSYWALARVSPTGDTPETVDGYFCGAGYLSGAVRWQIGKRVGGIVTILVSATSPTVPSSTVRDLWFEVLDDAKILYYWDGAAWVQIISTADNEITQAGCVGVQLGGHRTDNNWIDNLEAIAEAEEPPTEVSGTDVVAGAGTPTQIGTKQGLSAEAVTGAGDVDESAQKTTSGDDVVAGAGEILVSYSAEENAGGFDIVSGAGDTAASGQKSGQAIVAHGGGGEITAAARKDAFGTDVIAGAGATLESYSAQEHAGGFSIVAGAGDTSASARKAAFGSDLLSGAGATIEEALKAAFGIDLVAGKGATLQAYRAEEHAGGFDIVSGGGDVVAVSRKLAFVLAVVAGGGDVITASQRGMIPMLFRVFVDDYSVNRAHLDEIEVARAALRDDPTHRMAVSDGP